MRYLTQTKFSNIEGTEHGNCFSTAIACLLDLDITDVPELQEHSDGGWYPIYKEFLNKHGFWEDGVWGVSPESSWNSDFVNSQYMGIDGLFIVGGTSPRGFARGHAAIYNKQGELIHDPHPSGDGVLKIEEIYLIGKNSDIIK